MPSRSKNFSLLVQQEMQLASSYSVMNVNSVNSSHVSSSLCTLCGKYGHSESACFKKNGFPNQESRSLKNNGNRKLCTYYNRNDHTIDSCYEKHGYPPGYKFYNSGQNNQANNVITSDEFFFKSCSKEQENKDDHFTAQQYHILFDMFKQNNNNGIVANLAQINQVESFSADLAHKSIDQSSKGNIFFNSSHKIANFLDS